MQNGESGARFLVDSRLADGVGRDQLIEYFEQHHFDSSTWYPVRHRVVADYMFKVGDQPGVVLFLDVDRCRGGGQFAASGRARTAPHRD